MTTTAGQAVDSNEEEKPQKPVDPSLTHGVSLRPDNFNPKEVFGEKRL